MVNLVKNGNRSEDCAVMAADVYRRFTRAMSAFDEFDGFRKALETAVQGDVYLEAALMAKPGQTGDTIPFEGEREAEEIFSMGRVVLPLQGAVQGEFLGVEGRRDGRPFGGGDLHLMGALADFISVMVLNAVRFRQQRQAADILKYLIGQLPLGVVCFAMDGDVIVANQLAGRMLGEAGVDILREGIDAVPRESSKRYRRQFEVGEHFLYTEGRILAVDGAGQVAAFVVYDMSASKEKLRVSLERDFYLSDSRGRPLVLCALGDKRRAGAAYRALKEATAGMEPGPDHLLAVDAHHSVASFTQGALRQLRTRLRACLPEAEREGMRLSLVALPAEEGDAATGVDLLERAMRPMRAAAEALRPAVGVVDSFRDVADSLELLAGDRCRFENTDLREALSGESDASFFDAFVVNVDELDGATLEVFARLSRDPQSRPDPVLFATTYKQPGMLRRKLALPREFPILQKPFSEALVRQVFDRVAV